MQPFVRILDISRFARLCELVLHAATRITARQMTKAWGYAIEKSEHEMIEFV